MPESFRLRVVSYKVRSLPADPGQLACITTVHPRDLSLCGGTSPRDRAVQGPRARNLVSLSRLSLSPFSLSLFRSLPPRLPNPRALVGGVRRQAVRRQVFQVPYILRFEPSLDAFSLRSDVMRSLKIHSSASCDLTMPPPLRRFLEAVNQASLRSASRGEPPNLYVILVWPKQYRNGCPP